MNYYKDETTNEVYAYDDDQVNDGCVLPHLVAMTDEEIKDHLAPKVNKEQEVENALYKKKYLMSEVSIDIDTLSDAVEFGDATKDEESLLVKLRKYRIELSRVNELMAPDIEWPVKPE